MLKKYKISGAAIMIKWWKGPPVLVILPTETIELRTERAHGYPIIRIPSGPIEIRSLTKKEKQFLLARGMAPGIINEGRVLAVSKESANRFDTDRKTFVDLARRFGLSEDDLLRITKAQEGVRAFRPQTYDERRAVLGLSWFLGCKNTKKQRGRPGKVTAEDRHLMKADAQQLKREGKSTKEIVRALAQRYELRFSYAKRILEDSS